MGRGVSARLQTAVATVYPKCGANFRAVGCCVCSADYPSGMADIEVSCTTKSYRGPTAPGLASPGGTPAAGLVNSGLGFAWHRALPFSLGSSVKSVVLRRCPAAVNIVGIVEYAFLITSQCYFPAPVASLHHIPQVIVV
jgi:hypothetical protein